MLEAGSDNLWRSLATDTATQTHEISRAMCFVTSTSALFSVLKGWLRLKRGCWMVLGL